MMDEEEEEEDPENIIIMVVVRAGPTTHDERRRPPPFARPFPPLERDVKKKLPKLNYKVEQQQEIRSNTRAQEEQVAVAYYLRRSPTI